MKYILVLIVFVNGSPESVATEEFESRRTCELAGSMSQQMDMNFMDNTQILYECYEK